MKKYTLGIITLLFLLLASFITYYFSDSYNEKAIKKSTTRYYDSLINQKYKEAFKEVFLYDGDPQSGETNLAESEIKKIIKDKISVLENSNYKVKSYTIKDIEYEDANSFWLLIDVTVNENDIDSTYNEVVFFNNENNKIFFKSDDPNLMYRDGNMNTEK